MKKIAFKARPPTGGHSGSADDWVHDRSQPTEPIKRLTIDIPESLHRRMKTACAMENLVMADVVRQMLERRFPLPKAIPNPTANAETQKDDSPALVPDEGGISR